MYKIEIKGSGTRDDIADALRAIIDALEDFDNTTTSTVEDGTLCTVFKPLKLPCLCMTCGARNDYSNPDGGCQNGHDNWLEYRDVISQNVFFKHAVTQSGLTEDQFTAKFMDHENTFIQQNT